jgi:hypothetical protein
MEQFVQRAPRGCPPYSSNVDDDEVNLAVRDGLAGNIRGLLAGIATILRSAESSRRQRRLSLTLIGW